jgi:hypothetical protein
MDKIIKTAFRKLRFCLRNADLVFSIQIADNWQQKVSVISQPYEENQNSILSIFGRDNRLFLALLHHSFDFWNVLFYCETQNNTGQ